MDLVRDAAAQAWPPFVLVAGLLMIGAVVGAAGLFERAGAFVGRWPGSPAASLAWCMALVAVVTATMNLDTAVVFLTPVLILVARRRGLDERPFLYAALFMANASSLFLPGANLTNLLVLGGEQPVGGAAFARAMIAPAAAAALVTAIGLWLLLGPRRTAVPVQAARASVPTSGSSAGVAPVRPATSPDDARSRPVAMPNPDGLGRRPVARSASWVAAAGAVAAACLTVAVHEPGLPVLVAGLAVAAVAWRQGTITPRAVVRAVGPAVLVGLFALSVALGVLARSWSGPADLLATAGVWETTGLATLAAITVNNLPAAVLLSAAHVEHPQALLIGLNLGPNLAVTGSLSSYLWYRAARQVGAQPSVVQVSRLGLVLAPVALVAATLMLSVSPGL